MSQIDQNMMLRKSQDILGISQDITTLSQARLGHLGLDQNISEYSKVSQDIFRMSQDISGQIRIS